MVESCFKALTVEQGRGRANPLHSPCKTASALPAYKSLSPSVVPRHMPDHVSRFGFWWTGSSELPSEKVNKHPLFSTPMKQICGGTLHGSIPIPDGIRQRRRKLPPSSPYPLAKEGVVLRSFGSAGRTPALFCREWSVNPLLLLALHLYEFFAIHEARSALTKPWLSISKVGLHFCGEAPRGKNRSLFCRSPQLYWRRCCRVPCSWWSCGRKSHSRCDQQFSWCATRGSWGVYEKVYRCKELASSDTGVGKQRFGRFELMDLKACLVQVRGVANLACST